MEHKNHVTPHDDSRVFAVRMLLAEAEATVIPFLEQGLEKPVLAQSRHLSKAN